MITASCVLLLSAVAAGVDVDIHDLDGAAHTGQLVSLSADEVTLKTAEGDLKMPLRKLFSLVPVLPVAEDELAGEVVVDLIDGSKLKCEAYQVESGRATLTFAKDDQTRAATRSIRAVRFHQQNPDLRRQWNAIATAKATADLLVIRKTVKSTDDNGVEKTLASLDPLEGVVYDINEDVVSFDFDGSRIDVPRAKVEGVIYFRQSTGRPAEPICRAFDNRGSAWNLKSIALQDDLLKGVSAGGVRAAIPVGRLAKIDFSIGNLVFLSDLKPESVSWIPLIQSRVTPPSLEKLFRPQFDRAFFGGPLILDGEPYAKGISLHSRTVVKYRLTREFQRLAAKAGIDDRFAVDGNVTLSISGDGEVLLTRKISGADPPVDIDLDLHGVRRLTILVDFGEDHVDVGDYLNLCNARLLK